MSMEREESFFMDIQKSCRFGEFPGLQLFFLDSRARKHRTVGILYAKNYFRASISLATSFRFSRIERP